MKRIVRILCTCLLAVASALADDSNITVTVDGVTYHNVRFVHPTPATITIYHSSGIATVPLAKLPSDLQKKFNYDPQQAAQWEADQQKLAAEASENQRERAARWKAAKDRAAAEAAALEDTQRKTAAAVSWTVKIQAILPDAVLAWGCPGANPNCPDSKTILLVNPPALPSLAEGEQLTATAYRDGVGVAQSRTLEKWICLQGNSSAGPQTSAPPEPPSASTPGQTYFPDLPNNGAFGFPQADSTTLCSRPALRFSVFSNAQYLFAQAIVWKDDDPSPLVLAGGSRMDDSSMLILDLDGDGKLSPNVDRQYTLNSSPTLSGLKYQIYLSAELMSNVCRSPTGRGAIRFVRLADGRRVRVDTYLIPLAELSRHPGDQIRIYYSANSPKPPLLLNSARFDSGVYSNFEKGQPYVLGKGRDIDPTKVPDGSNDNNVTQ